MIYLPCSTFSMRNHIINSTSLPFRLRRSHSHAVAACSHFRQYSFLGSNLNDDHFNRMHIYFTVTFSTCECPLVSLSQFVWPYIMHTLFSSLPSLWPLHTWEIECEKENEKCGHILLLLCWNLVVSFFSLLRPRMVSLSCLSHTVYSLNCKYHLDKCLLWRWLWLNFMRSHRNYVLVMVSFLLLSILTARSGLK